MSFDDYDPDKDPKEVEASAKFDRENCYAYKLVTGSKIETEKGWVSSSDKLKLYVGDNKYDLDTVKTQKTLFVKLLEKFKGNISTTRGKTLGDTDCSHFIPVTIIQNDFELGTTIKSRNYWHGTVNDLIRDKRLYIGPSATDKSLSAMDYLQADYYRVANLNLNLNQPDARQIRPRGAPGGGGKSKRSSVRRRQSRHRRRRTNRSTRRK